MKLRVFVERQKKYVSIEVPKGTTVRVLLEKLKLNPVAVVTTIGNEVVTEDCKIEAEEKINIHSVVSGG